MFRRILSVFLSAVLVFCIIVSLPLSVNAHETDLSEVGSYADERWQWTDAGVQQERCTYRAWHEAYDRLGISLPLTWGNAATWAANARNDGFYVDNTPSVNSIVCWSGYTWGHVAYVTGVDDNNIYVREGGINPSDSYPNYWFRDTSFSKSNQNRWGGYSLEGYIHLGGSNPPDKPNNLHTESGASVFRTDEYITFVWDRVSTADHYWVYMWKNGTEIYHTSVGNNTSHTTAPLGVGSYSFAVRAGNNIGYSDTVDVSFTVTDSVPDEPSGLKTSTGASLFRSDEYITFTWDRVSTADHYWVYMWRDGTEIYHTYVGNNTSHTTAPLKAGSCKLLVRAGNSYGYSDTVGVNFEVVDTAPSKPTNLHTETGKNLFRADESITFSWDKVTTADHYWVYMWKDGTEISHTYVGNNTTHTTAPLGAGSYSFAVRAGNSYGYSGTVDVDFVVTDSVPSKPTNLHTETGGTSFNPNESITFLWDSVTTADHYWVYMWKDGTEIYHTYVGNNTAHTTAPLGAGSYSFAVRAGNSYGYSGTVDVDFVVESTEPPTTPTEPKTIILGDVDGDDEVSIIDATLIQRKLVELPVSIFNELAADVDENGLDITDATYIQRHLAEIYTPYPIGEQIQQS